MFEKERAAATQRSIERRRRENAAPRLNKEVPSLVRLRVAVTESGGFTTKKHVRHVVVASAPALFVFECGDELCREGGHDVTTSVLYALRGMRTTFEEHHSCDGTVGSSGCRRLVDLTFFAEYT
jgi:hypothetical protein